MLVTIIRKSFLNQKKAMALMIAAVVVGTAMPASLVSISLEIRGKVSRELRSFGANIVVEPKIEGLADISGQKRYLRQEDIVKSKTIFWRHNILGIAPFLETKAEVLINGKVESVDLIGTWYERQLPLPGEKKTFPAGIATVSPWWNIDGQWPDSKDEVIIGSSLSKRLGIKAGDNLRIDSSNYRVSGTLETGGVEDDRIFMEMDIVQYNKGLHGNISSVLVSALTRPMDEFAQKKTETMSQVEYEKWYCTGYVTSISRQLEEVFQGSKAKPVWRIAETEGRVLKKLTLLIYFLSIIVLVAAALGVSATMIMSLLRRTDEIGLMKAIGADSGNIITIFLSEGIMIGFIGGLLGYVLSIAAAEYIGVQVFGTGFELRAMLLPAAIGSAVLISVIGTILPIRRALNVKPAVVLKGSE
jgi:putative ABC transport system permease protein